MGLNAALKDRARVKRKEPLPTRVAGKTLSEPTWGAWFRARLELPSGLERTGPGDRRRAVTAPTLMCGVRDAEGQPIRFHIRDELEVDSDELGFARWNITADPAPIRKKKRVIGWTVTLQRIEEHEFTPRLPALPEQ